MDSRSSFLRLRTEAAKESGHDAEAVADFDKAIKIAPENANLYADKGLALFHEGKYEDSAAAYRRALDHHKACVVATTSADRNAYQLLNNVCLNMGQLSDKYINMQSKMAYIAPVALQNDELNKRIVSCGHFLATTAASGRFNDDRSCH